MVYMACGVAQFDSAGVEAGATVVKRKRVNQRVGFLGNVVTIIGAAENGRVERLRSGFLCLTVIILQTYTEGKPIRQRSCITITPERDCFCSHRESPAQNLS